MNQTTWIPPQDLEEPEFLRDDYQVEGELELSQLTIL